MSSNSVNEALDKVIEDLENMTPEEKEKMAQDFQEFCAKRNREYIEYLHRVIAEHHIDVYSEEEARVQAIQRVGDLGKEITSTLEQVISQVTFLINKYKNCAQDKDEALQMLDELDTIFFEHHEDYHVWSDILHKSRDAYHYPWAIRREDGRVADSPYYDRKEE